MRTEPLTPGSPPRAAAASAPGRCTIVGEHVDYAAGMVLGVAIDLSVSVAVQVSRDGVFHAESAGRQAIRADPRPVGDIGDRIFAAAIALRERGIDVPAIDARVSSTLPEGAGLASSAAVICATLAALLRLTHSQVTVATLVALALSAERDIVGVPCGDMDQHLVVESHAASAMLLDCRSGARTHIRWPWGDVVLCVCDTGEHHDVGGAGYRRRRTEAAAALLELGVESAQDIPSEIPGEGVMQRRARHLRTESQRSVAAAGAVAAGDAAGLGALMTASHRSLRDDYEVSTRRLDEAVEAALGIPGCYGARMVGAGFGGAALALVDDAAAAACARAMTAAIGAGPGSAWITRPGAGLADGAADVISSG
jgi:galactokinase